MSKINTLLFLWISVIMLPVICQAQTEILSDTLLWQAKSMTDLATDTTAENGSTFVTYGSTKIRWTQPDAEPVVFDFDVQSIENQWTTAGYIVFTTIRKGKTRSFRFENNNGIRKVILSYAIADGTRNIVFLIDQVIQNPN